MADVEVTFTVTTDLRQISFHLAKETNSSGKAEWTLDFTLSEKKQASDPIFKEVISLHIKVKPSNFNKAQVTSDKGLNSAQTAQAHLAGDASKLASEGVISEKIAKTQAEKVISVR